MSTLDPYSSFPSAPHLRLRSMTIPLQESPGTPAEYFRLSGFPPNADWHRFDVFQAGPQLRIAVFMRGSRNTLYLGRLSESGTFLHQGNAATPKGKESPSIEEVSLIDASPDADLSSIGILSDGHASFLFTRSLEDEIGIHTFKYDPARRAFRPQGSQYSFPYLNLLNNPHWEAWKVFSPYQFFQKMNSLFMGSALASSESLLHAFPPIGIERLAMITDASGLRLFFLESAHSHILTDQPKDQEADSSSQEALPATASPSAPNSAATDSPPEDTASESAAASPPSQTPSSKSTPGKTGEFDFSGSDQKETANSPTEDSSENTTEGESSNMNVFF